MLCDHVQDNTPCGQNSPFNRLIENAGKILMIGCGLTPNTTMHAVEEYVRPPYLFGPSNGRVPKGLKDERMVEGWEVTLYFERKDGKDVCTKVQLGKKK